MTLDEFDISIRNCQQCRLASTRTQVVFGVGNPNAAIMFIGEAPGFYEDKQGEPFVGAAGKLLTELLELAGLFRKDVYIANVIKCRPPNNRNPMPDEIETCKPFLMRQIELINPKVICTLGNFAIRTMLGKQVSITKIRGQHFDIQGFHVLPMLHPAAALYQGSFRALIQEDFHALKTFLDNLPVPTSKLAEQMGLLG